MVENSCGRVFCGELFTVKLEVKKELCEVCARRISQTHSAKESQGKCEVGVSGTTRLRNLKGASACQLDTVSDWNTGLVVLVLAVHCTDKLRTFRYNNEARHFDPLAELEIGKPNRSAWMIADGPSLAVSGPKALKLHSLEPSGYLSFFPGLARSSFKPDGSCLQVAFPDGTTAPDAIMTCCSVELVLSGPSQCAHATLCVVASKYRLTFVAATVAAGSGAVLPAVLFLGSLYEEAQIRACCVVLPEPQVQDASELKEAFAENVTAICTTSGTLLVLRCGRCLYRCHLPFTDPTHLVCWLRSYSVDYLVVWALAGGAAIFELDSDKRLQVLHHFAAECAVVCGDLLRWGSRQALSFSPEKADQVQWRLLGPDRRPSGAKSTGGLRDVIEALHHHSAAGQSVLHKTRRALAQSDALLEEAVDVITARQLRGVTESRPQAASCHLVPVLPPGQASPICPVPEETSSSETILLHCWAHIWGPRLLLGWVFQRPASMHTQPPVFLASPGVTFGVRLTADNKRVTVASSCRLPAEPTLQVSLVAGPLHHHQTIVFDNVPPVRLQEPRATSARAVKEVMTSQRAAQENRCFGLNGLSAATANELLLALFDRVAPGLYVCCDASSPLLRSSADLSEDPSGTLYLSLYAEDKAQHALLKRQLAGRFPSDISWIPRPGREESERLASALRREASLATALAAQPERYIALRRELQETEWQTDFLAQGLFDQQASTTNV